MNKAVLVIFAVSSYLLSGCSDVNRDNANKIKEQEGQIKILESEVTSLRSDINVIANASKSNSESIANLASAVRSNMQSIRIIAGLPIRDR